MRKLFKKLIKEDLYLLVILLLMGISIVVKSFYSNCGYLSPDSINYLELAKNLINDNGFYGPYNWRQQNDTFFCFR